MAPLASALDFKAIAADLAPRVLAVRRHLHTYPEPSGLEFSTTQFLASQCAEAGLEVSVAPGGRGAVVESAQPAGGPRLALRADIDALRIEEQSGLPFASAVPGVMHACGHDGHAAVVFGAALLLEEARRRELLPVPVPWRVIFQPAEETAEGAREMIAAGALKRVGAILACHLDPSRHTGRIGIRNGAMTAACDELRFELFGRGGHAARPHESLDPIAAAAQLVSSIYLFVPRAVDSHEPVVVTIGQIYGGDNPNVIPERVLLRGTLRTLGQKVRNTTLEHLRQLARGLAEASGVRIETAFSPGPSAVENDAAMADLLRTAARGQLGGDAVEEIARPSMGGEDFAAYLDHVPGAMFRLGCCPATQSCPPLHAPNFQIDEQALLLGAQVLAQAAVSWAQHTARPD